MRVTSTYLSKEGAQRLKHGDPYATREEIIRIEGTPAPGEAVQLRDEQGHSLGYGDVDLSAVFPVRRIGYPEESAEGLIPRQLRRAMNRRLTLVENPRFC